MLEPWDATGARLPRVATAAGVAALLRDTQRDDAWLLAVADVPQSYVDLADPTHLEFDYVRLLGDVADLAAPAGVPLRAVHLGGGAGTLARYVGATRPGSRQVVVEVDPGLARLVARRLGTPGFSLVVGDARAVLARLPPASADLVVLDAFAAAAVPPHLTTVEQADAARRVLAAGGSYAVNVADSGALPFARAVAATLRSRFAAAVVLAPPAVLRGRRFGNVVLVAGDGTLPAETLARRAAGRAAAPARLLTGEALTAWVGDALALTDATTLASPTPPPGVFTLSGPVAAGRPAQAEDAAGRSRAGR